MRRAEKTVFKNAVGDFISKWCMDENGVPSISTESEICIMLGGFFKQHPDIYDTTFTRLCIRVFNTKVNNIESAEAPRGSMEFGAFDENSIQRDEDEAQALIARLYGTGGVMGVHEVEPLSVARYIILNGVSEERNEPMTFSDMVDRGLGLDEAEPTTSHNPSNRTLTFQELSLQSGPDFQDQSEQAQRNVYQRYLQNQLNSERHMVTVDTGIPSVRMPAEVSDWLERARNTAEWEGGALVVPTPQDIRMQMPIMSNILLDEEV